MIPQDGSDSAAPAGIDSTPDPRMASEATEAILFLLSERLTLESD